MRKLLLLPLVFLASAPRADTLALPQAILEALTPIDSLPTVAALDHVFGSQPQPDTVSNLAMIALSADPTLDFGVQLHAIRALPDYCPVGQPCGATPNEPLVHDTVVHATLIQLIAQYQAIAQAAPRDVLRLRAAIEALGLAGVSAALRSDEELLILFLNHPSRDVRATTAKALGTLCITFAVTPLRTRFAAETVAQVKLAISAALREPCLTP